MSGRAPDTLPTWQDFGEDLITSYDLDPIYPMAAKGVTDYKQLKRWCLAYWCYYHAGVSSLISEAHPKDFYEVMRDGVDQNWPRGMERRYFYGDLAWNTIAGLERFGPPEKVVDAMTLHHDFHSANKAIQEFYGFGEWIAWKIADMTDRVLQIELDFNGTNLNMYKDPTQGAAYILTGDKHHPIDEIQLNQLVDDMEEEFSWLDAPPFLDRPINIQEVETVLCKYKAHCFGFYPYGNDTTHIAKALPGWGDLAEQLLLVLREVTTYD
jgi:hypothetical protein